MQTRRQPGPLLTNRHRSSQRNICTFLMLSDRMQEQAARMLAARVKRRGGNGHTWLQAHAIIQISQGLEFFKAAVK